MLSVLILTLNEEANIKRCIDSIKSISDDIVVLDSYSTDKTVEIAKSCGARVIQRKFDDEQTHRTFSIREISFKYRWVYNPDADEITPPDLANELVDVTQRTETNICAYRVRFKTMFFDRWIRYSSLYPTWVVRLFIPDKVSFSRKTNLSYEISGETGYLKSHFLHYTFNNGFNAWFDKHNNYSHHEANETLISLESKRIHIVDVLTDRNPVSRRRSLKELSFRLPLRPLLRFIYMYIFRFGFLDGLPGLHYCLLLSIYEYMITLKITERRRRSAGKTI